MDLPKEGGGTNRALKRGIGLGRQRRGKGGEGVWNKGGVNQRVAKKRKLQEVFQSEREACSKRPPVK